jgi:hypothetical protein
MQPDEKNIKMKQFVEQVITPVIENIVKKTMQESSSTILKAVSANPDVKTDRITKKDSPAWFDGVLLKIVISLLIFLIPLISTFFIYLTNMDSRVKILEERSKTIDEMRVDIKDMNKSINELKVHLANGNNNQR